MNIVQQINGNMNSNEKVARAKSGIEDAEYFKVSESTELEKMEAVNRYNQRVDDYVQKLDEHAKTLDSYAEQFNERIEDFEIKAIGSNILVQPFSQNPFQRIKRDENSGIIIDLGGQKPQYKSNETGQWEEEEQFIHVGTVIDAGPDCKYIQEDDVIMWTKPSEMPVPFFKQDIYMVPEQRVLCVINAGLTKRFNEYKNGR